MNENINTEMPASTVELLFYHLRCAAVSAKVGVRSKNSAGEKTVHRRGKDGGGRLHSQQEGFSTLLKENKADQLTCTITTSI